MQAESQVAQLSRLLYARVVCSYYMTQLRKYSIDGVSP